MAENDAFLFIRRMGYQPNGTPLRRAKFMTFLSIHSLLLTHSSLPTGMADISIHKAPRAWPSGSKKSRVYMKP